MTGSHQIQTPVRLAPYEEIRGRLHAICDDGHSVSIELSSGTLQFDTDSREAERCRRELRGAEGALVSVLRTPVGDAPIRVRIETSAD